jgi:hypothetical protein
MQGIADLVKGRRADCTRALSAHHRYQFRLQTLPPCSLQTNTTALPRSSNPLAISADLPHYLLCLRYTSAPPFLADTV